ncbi:flavin reductase family protein [Hyphobacterium marinum]|uniref:Flavin reductase family protein n=1 Tax=Hyphobacterium marinum TaxID=3116574 RepID=A0ABU7LYQ4_9PROT|nr:flavin reductase family protein [Hyphobacterium sp. Y6023]MEE2566693.1 flavin reductase family protein [Hyphobacterium sp. Y6023]
MVDPREFRDAMSRYPTGVTLVAARHEGAALAMTVNSFASVSLEPPLILWSVGRDTERYAAFRAAEDFSINILRDTQMDLAPRYALDAALDPADWDLEGEGAPVLKDALARLHCRRYAVHPGGDHDIIVGEVMKVDCGADEGALTFFRSRYGRASVED